MSLLIFWSLLQMSSPARAAGTICATCQMQVGQQLTFERQAFNATMTITNGLANTSLDNLSVVVYFTDAQGHSVTSTDSSSATGNTFFCKYTVGPSLPTSVAGGATANLGWQIIPSPGASGSDPNGTEYYVGATLTYTVGGQSQSVTVSPNYIFVQPQPQLILDYFLPAQVYGQDPTSTAVTPPIPFNLGVRVTNTGNGVATNLQINSGQPKLSDPSGQRLAAQFVLLGASVNDAALAPTLLANFGLVGSHQASVARWVMTSSLSGKFSFITYFSHADSLGGSVTSEVTSTASNQHSLVHDILVDLPGRDNVRDFLALPLDAIGMTDLKVYESQGMDTGTLVQDVSDSSTLVASGGGYQLHVPVSSGYIYAKTTDPSNGLLTAQSAVRADGKQINANNIWLSRTFNTGTNQWDHYFNLFDVNNTTGLSYTISFGASPLPPVFGPLSDHVLASGQAFSLQVSATDPDGSTPVITSGPLPPGAVLGSSAEGKATMSWTPGSGLVGNFPVSFIASEGALSTVKTINLTVGAGTLLQNWKNKYNLTDSGDSANPAKDSLSNLLKYALNLDPTKQSPNSGILIGTTQTGGHTYLTLTYVVRTDDPTLTYTVVGSNSPSASDETWTAQTQAVTVSQDGVDSGMQRYEVQDSVPIDGLTHRFLKLRVTNTGGN